MATVAIAALLSQGSDLRESLVYRLSVRGGSQSPNSRGVNNIYLPLQQLARSGGVAAFTVRRPHFTGSEAGP